METESERERESNFFYIRQSVTVGRVNLIHVSTKVKEKSKGGCNVNEGW